jgi:hypothetical protein
VKGFPKDCADFVEKSETKLIDKDDKCGGSYLQYSVLKILVIKIQHLILRKILIKT